MKKVIKIQRKNHVQETLDGEQLELKIIRKKNTITIDVYNTLLNKRDAIWRLK